MVYLVVALVKPERF
nr:potassium-transporting ATPase subunit F [Frigoribacterium sp. VKM Ac-2836]